MTNPFRMGAVAACAALLAFAQPPAARAAECTPFPAVALWGEYTHDTVRRHVQDRLAGDWAGYTGQLLRQLAQLRDLYSQGSGVAVKRGDRTVRLTGEEFAAYIRLAEQRLTIVRCLADSESALKFANFSTAAGTPANLPANSAAKSQDPVKESMQRTYVTLPESLLEKLRKAAVRRSAKDGRQVSVSEVVTEILERELRR